jgi:hypothetical protein
MRLLTQAQVERRPDDLVVRQSRWTAAASATAFAGIAAGVAAAVQLGWLPGFFWVSAVILGLIALLPLGQLRAALRSSNWTVIARGDVLFVKLRSYLNHHFDADDEVVLELTASDVGAARERVQQMQSTLGDGTVRWTQVDVEFDLDGDTTDIADALEAERHRRPPHRAVSSHSRHRPVSMPAEGTIRIAWRGRQDRLTPAASSLLDRLGPAVPTDVTDEDRRPDTLSGDEVDALVLDLAESGATIDAVKLLRERYGYGLAEAKQFVDGLLRDEAA